MTLQADEIAWYPMRATYARAAKMKELLDEKGVQNYLPMRYMTHEDREGNRNVMLSPVISGLIFVHESKDSIVQLKQNQAFAPLQFYTRPQPERGNLREILVVPDKQMDDFIRISSSDDERVVLLEDSDYLSAAGSRVRIIEGPFAGVEGIVKRIKNNKCVMVRIEGVACAAILRFPARFLLRLDS